MMAIKGDEKFIQLMQEEMAQCSPEFMRAVDCLSTGDYEKAASWFQRSWMNAEDRGIREGGFLHVSREWIDAFCGSMFCAMSLGYYQDVVQMDKKFAMWLMAQPPTSRTGEKLMIDGGVPSRAGWCWYFDATVISYDHLDLFNEAVLQADMAIEYFKKNNNPGNLGYHLSKKANILQQRASAHSLTPETHQQARGDIVEAIRAMYESLLIFTEGWEEDCARPLTTMKQVANRLGVFVSDLYFVDWSSDAGKIIAHFFRQGEKGEQKRPIEQAVDLFNQACKARDEKQYELSERLFEGSLRLAPEESEYDRALKGFILYQFGVFLLHVNGLEEKRGTLSDHEFEVVRRIHDLWAQTRSLVDGISIPTLRSFSFPIWDAIQAIKEDQWIRLAGLTRFNPTTGKLEMRPLAGNTSTPERKPGLLGKLFGKKKT